MTESLLDRRTVEELHALIDDATDEQAATILAGIEAELYDWTEQARPDQIAPAGVWLLWLLLGGRGAGKTRTGAEYVKAGSESSLLNLAGARWALVGETFADVRDTMVEGDSGLLSILPPSSLLDGSRERSWNRSLGELRLANGSRARAYASERPGQLRGPQHHGAWGDEPAKWRDAHKGDADDTTWSNLLLGLRLGPDPRVCLTGTPRRVRLLLGTNERPGLIGIAQATGSLTHSTTLDNLANLSPTFMAQVLDRYKGTRLERQEILAELLEDVEGALWDQALVELYRVSDFPELGRLVIAVDPAVTDSEAADDTGIIAVGRNGADAYVLEDLTVHLAPTPAMTTVVEAYHDLAADHVVVESNNGGDYLPALIHAIDPSVVVQVVSASRGKRVRAEPVHGLYEQGRVHHVGSLPALEDQLATWVPGEDSPDRLDALVYGVTDLFPELAVGQSRRLVVRHA